MRDINRCIFCGRLTRDMELRYTNSGTAIGSFSLAVNNTQKQDDRYVDKPSFLEFTWWGKAAEAVAGKQLMTKGAQVFVESHAELQEWTDKNTGDKRKTVKFIVDHLIVGRPGKSATGYGEDTDPSGGPYDDDVPF